MRTSEVNRHLGKIRQAVLLILFFRKPELREKYVPEICRVIMDSPFRKFQSTLQKV